MTHARSLVAEIVSGNRKAFQSLIMEYQRLVSHIVFRMIYNQEDRKDICQDVFVKVYQNLKEFNFESKLSTWIAKIAYNTCINFLEKKRVLLFDDLTSEGQSLDNCSVDDILPDESVERDDLSFRLQAEIEKMPVHFRTILTLFHLDQMSYGEISEIMQLPEGTVKSYLFRARKLLKEKLLSKYQKEELWQ
jgi:RNA polymerase sigma-70 factor (ECF subfamily)